MEKKTWILTTALLLLSEYIIFNWTYNFGSDKNLTDHVSFAGTIVSIILAVVAIIYSFIQADSQTKSSNAIAAQITSLRDVVRDIDLSKSQFTNELDRIEHLASTLDIVGSHVDETHQAVSTIGSEIKQISKIFEQRKEQEAVAPEPIRETDNDVNEAHFRLVTATIDTMILAYCLKQAIGKNIPENTLLMRHYAFPIAELKYKYEENAESWKREVDRWIWPALQIMRIFKEFNLIEIEQDNDIVIVNPTFIRVLDSVRFEGFTGAIKADIDAVKQTFQD